MFTCVACLHHLSLHAWEHAEHFGGLSSNTRRTFKATQELHITHTHTPSYDMHTRCKARAYKARRGAAIATEYHWLAAYRRIEQPWTCPLAPPKLPELECRPVLAAQAHLVLQQ